MPCPQTLLVFFTPFDHDIRLSTLFEEDSILVAAGILTFSQLKIIIL